MVPVPATRARCSRGRPERRRNLISEPGLQVHHPGGGVEPRPCDSLVGRQALVQRPCQHLHERAAEPRSTRRATGESGPSPSSARVGDIMLPIRCPGRSGSRIRSASPSMGFRCRSSPGSHPRAEPEAGGEHADVALLVDRHEIGGVTGAVWPVERPGERHRPLAAGRPRSCGSASRQRPSGARPARVSTLEPA